MSTVPFKHNNRKNAVLLLAGLLTLYVFVPRLSSFKNSFATVRDADFAFVGLGVLLWLATFLAAAVVYKFIALKALPYRRTLLIQLASGFTNRLVPIGAGAVALNIRYLTKQGRSAIQAAAITALNNLLGFVGNAVLLLGAIVLSRATFSNSFKVHIQPSARIVLAIAVLLIAALIYLRIADFKLVHKIEENIGLMSRHIVHKPLYLAGALAASMAITSFYALALYSVGLAFNVRLSIAQTLLVLTFGVAVATVTPTPGGLGGAEAGLVAALLSVGVTSHQALTVALTYRFLVYWLPILPGFICFQLALRRRYI